MKVLNFAFGILFLATSGVVCADEVSQLILELASKDKNVRYEAARKISRNKAALADDRMIEPLKKTMNDDSYSLSREYAAEALMAHKSKGARSSVLTALISPSSKGQAAAAQAVNEDTSKEVRVALLEAIKSKDKNVRYAVARSLSRSHSANGVVYAILSVVAKRDTYSLVRSESINGMVKSKRDSVEDDLISIMEASTSVGQAEAAYYLKKVNSGKATPYLIDALKDERTNVRYEAARSLSKITKGDKILVGVLLNAFKNDSYSLVKEYAIEGIFNSDDARAKELAENILAKGEKAKYFRQALKHITRTGELSSIESIADLLGSDNESIRMKARNAIASILKRNTTAEKVDHIISCLGETKIIPYKEGTKNVAVIFDIFLFAGLPLTSYQATKGHESIDKIPQDVIEAFKKLVKALPKGELG